ncbi:hypothetical protein L2E82_00889 [Cichorium intybus]|uniref:Uncharacterized protein n=1 Tax=Cichorium intybus TaxID=13427 RepID=A0ACB9GXG8_CICIN|nr:hypothetical protein L2E82_00889 [Cichorium intybus]
MLEEGLVNLLVVGFGESGRKASEIRILLARIEDSESFAPSVGELQRVECLRSLSEIAIALAERPARGDLTGEEVEELIEFLKSTWRILGITETIYHTCYVWVLFCQILQDVETISKATDEHPLALLGDETKKHLKKDATVFEFVNKSTEALP